MRSQIAAQAVKSPRQTGQFQRVQNATIPQSDTIGPLVNPQVPGIGVLILFVYSRDVSKPQTKSQLATAE